MTLSIIIQLSIVRNPEFSFYTFGSDMLSEFVAMIFGALIFDALIMFRQDIRKTSETKQLIVDLEELIKSLNYTFDCPLSSISAQNKSRVLWSQESFDILQKNLIITEDNKSAFPEIPWYVFFALQGEKLLSKLNNIKSQYSEVLDDPLADELFYLLNSSEMLTSLSNIKTIYETDVFTKNNRAKNFGSYFSDPIERDFEAVEFLQFWLENTKSEFAKSNKIKMKLVRISQRIFPVLMLFFSVYFVLKTQYIFAAVLAFSALVYIVSTIFFKPKN